MRFKVWKQTPISWIYPNEPRLFNWNDAHAL